MHCTNSGLCVCFVCRADKLFARIDFFHRVSFLQGVSSSKRERAKEKRSINQDTHAHWSQALSLLCSPTQTHTHTLTHMHRQFGSAIDKQHLWRHSRWSSQRSCIDKREGEREGGRESESERRKQVLARISRGSSVARQREKATINIHAHTHTGACSLEQRQIDLITFQIC